MAKKNYWENQADWEWPDEKDTIENSDTEDRAPSVFTQSEVGLMNSMRMLWEQHGAWTRMAIISIVHDLGDTSYTLKRLLRNPRDFEALLRHFYGEEKAHRFAALLKEHLVIAADLVRAAKRGDAKAAAAIEAKWYRNANEIAAFMASINPEWSEEEFRSLLHEHLKMVKDQAAARIAGRYARDIAIYDEMEQQLLDIADAMTSGIALQFPNLFVRE